MTNSELPDILELKNIRQSYTENGQEKVVIDGLNLLIEDSPGKGEFIVILGASGCGKCVAKGTWVVTSEGLRRIEDLFEPSDKVPGTLRALSSDAKLAVIVGKNVERVTHRYYGGLQKTLKVTSENGVTLEGTPEHPIYVLREGAELWVKLADLRKSDLLIQECNQIGLFKTMFSRVCLPRAVPKSHYTLVKRVRRYKKIGLNNREISKLTELSPMTVGRYVHEQMGKLLRPKFKSPLFVSTDMAYYLGLLAGDGCVVDYVSLTTMDKEIQAFFTKYTKRHFCTAVHMAKKKGCRAVFLRPLSNPFYKDWMSKVFGGSCNADTKDVPRTLRLASFKHQLAFLQGLMDTDGSSDIRNKRAEISLNSEPLIDFVCAMISVLGIPYTRTKRGKSFRVSMRQSPGVSKLFRLQRKVQDPNQVHKPLEKAYLGIASITHDENIVYDLTNPKSQSFVANSLVVHNSTILRYVCGLQTPTSGEVLLYGRPRQITDCIGMVFQKYSSFEHMSVLDNVALGLRYRGISKKQREEKAREMIAKVGLDGHETKYAKYPNLSGGQLQRVAIARSLAYESKILLMDEPFGALDIETRTQMQDLLADIWLSITPTVILVTHDIPEAVYLGDVIYVMGRNPGNIIKSFRSPLPLERNRQMKRSHEFIRMVQEIEDFMS